MKRRDHIWECGSRTIELGPRTILMGILNVTPDSFSDGGQFIDPGAACAHAGRLIADGADIIDVGGESTRPGAEPVDEVEERARVVPVIEAIRREYDVAISVDTRKASVAEAALEAGADIINDVSAGEGDARMFDVARTSGAGMVLMHMRGTPETMQDAPSYDNVVRTVMDYLAGRRDAALDAGLNAGSLVLDPGIGFGKTTTHNVRLLSALPAFRELQFPVLIGISRKRFLGELTGREVDQRLVPGIAGLVMAVAGGAHIARVHDVKESADALRIADKLLEEMD